MRRTFEQALKNGKIDIKGEYEKLYDLFYLPNELDGKSIRDIVDKRMITFPYRDTCLTLDEFNKKFDFNFVRNPDEFNEEYLISFCEYIYNFIFYLKDGDFFRYMDKSVYLQQIQLVVEKTGYEIIRKNNIVIFVPRNSVANVVAQSELIPDNLSYKIIQFNHHSTDIDNKKSTLVELANILEAKRAVLKKINNKLEDDIFFLLNNFNVRHNNADKESLNYNPKVSLMTKEGLAEIYNLLYDMILLALMELDYEQQKPMVKALKK